MPWWQACFRPFACATSNWTAGSAPVIPPIPARSGAASPPPIYGPGQAARRIEIVPDFANRVFEFSAAGTLAIRPDRVLGTGLRFAWVNRGMLFSRGPA
ncbi:hypothetical protein [[Roseibacterium] beibuensis]|uniref:hypothetical protein n=1 Tax=[Roseibacterium] beibuensis TaxID=1193142 RepID=UPI0031F03935